MITGTGTGTAAADRVHMELRDLELSGGASAGECLEVSRASHLRLSNVRISNSTVSGAIFKEVWDSRTEGVIVEQCGNGETNPALLFDAAAGVGTQGGCDTFYWHHTIFQQNTGTDVRFTGSTGDTAPDEQHRVPRREDGGRVRHVSVH